MNCVCKKHTLQVWKGYGGVGYGCHCGMSFLPTKYFATLKGQGTFHYEQFIKTLTSVKGICSVHNCPQCRTILKQKEVDNIVLAHCDHCHGLLFSTNQSRAFFTKYKLPKNDENLMGLLIDLPLIGLLLS